MTANVQPSGNIAFSLGYAQNPEKGGEIFLCNLTDESASVDEQIRDWKAISNPYHTQCYNIVISFSDKDTEKIRQIEDVNKRVTFERMMIKDFMDDLALRGNNVYDCPFIAAHHGNTDNEHFHISVLNTTIYGKHFHDSFIKKNACRAAAKISEKYGLEAAPKALKNERNHQKAVGMKAKSSLGKDDRTGKRTYTRIAKDPGELAYRAERVRLANKRKARCKYLIEGIAQDKATTSANFVQRLLAQGMRLYHDPKEGLYIVVRDEDEEKEYSYLLAKHLGVNLSLLPKVDGQAISRQRKEKPKKKNAAMKKVKTLPHLAHQAHAQSSPVGGVLPRRAGLLQPSPGAEDGQTMQGNVNPDGSYDEDDMDEELRRKSRGYHI